MNEIKILDGGLGSELIKRGKNLPSDIWSAEANTKYPNLVHKIHLDYINAGADYITTNTFRSTPRSYKKINRTNYIKKSKESFNNAIEIAKSASNNKHPIIGSIAPLEECYDPTLFPNNAIALSEFQQLGSWFLNSNVDILLLETMNSIIETDIAITALKPLKLPIWVSFVLKDNEHLLSGDKLIDALKLLAKKQVDTVLLNCNSIKRTYQSMNIISENWTESWGIYPNLGVGEPSIDGRITKYSSMDDFSDLIIQAINIGANILGACCGSSPEHIKQIKGLLN